MSDSIVMKPTPVGGGMAVLAALVATAVSIGFPTAVAACLVGVTVLFVGLLLPRPGVITVGAVCVLTGVVLAGLAGASGLAVGVGFVGAVVAWDVGHNTLSHGRHVGRDAASPAPEAVHAGASLLAGLVAVVLGFVVFVLATSGQPATAVAFLTLGAVLLVLAVK